VSDSIEDIRI